jgi:hypothetical protein
MRFDKDKFFANFKKEYLKFIDIHYKNDSISSIKKMIKTEIKKLQIKNNVKQIKERNVDYWLIRGWCLEEALLKIKEINKNRKPLKNNSQLSIGYWTSRGYDIEFAKNKISNIQKSRIKKSVKTRKENPNYIPLVSPFTKEYWIKKGISNNEEILLKINSQRKNNILYWLNKGFEKDESIKKVSEYQSKISKGVRRGPDCLPTQLDYWIKKGYNKEEAKIKLSERQKTFTLEKCVEKYGLEKGTEIYNKRQKDWIKKLFNEDTCLATGRSMLCDEFIDELILLISDSGITNNFLYGKNEKFIYDHYAKKANRYDLTYNKKIIEFNGDFWHANPSIFESNEIHKIKKIKCSEIWNQDARKLNLAKNYGYDILVIWDSNYINDKEGTLKKCKDFLGL